LAKKEGVSADRLQKSNHGGGGWLKYEWNEGIWNLDDESDYAIFVWRFTPSTDPTLHLRDPSAPLPPHSSQSQADGTQGEYTNPSYYAYKPAPAPPSSSRLTLSPNAGVRAGSSSIKSKRSTKSAPGANGVAGGRRGKTPSRIGSINGTGVEGEDDMPTHKKEFEKFHAENGVRTVIGQIGPVKGVRMLLREGYRHVYISRIFAAKHAFIPKDAVPGHYGYGGIVHIGKFPITLPGTRDASTNSNAPSSSSSPSKIHHTTTTHTIYLTEETHFDVVLGRAFIERRGVQFDGTDQTNVICRDKGERLEVEVVVLRDGRGEVVTVT